MEQAEDASQTGVFLALICNCIRRKEAMAARARQERDGEIEQEQQTQIKMNKKRERERESKRIDFGKRSLLKVLPSDCSKVPFFLLSSGHPRDVKCKVIVWPSALY